MVSAALSHDPDLPSPAAPPVLLHMPHGLSVKTLVTHLLPEESTLPALHDSLSKPSLPLLAVPLPTPSLFHNQSLDTLNKAFLGTRGRQFLDINPQWLAHVASSAYHTCHRDAHNDICKV